MDWFIAGTIPLLVAGGMHAVLAVVDAMRPTFFASLDGSVEPAMEGSGVRLVRMFGVSGDRPSVWSMWLGINVSHGLGVFSVGLLCLLIATYDYGLIDQIEGLRAFTIAFPAVYLVVALRFWFYGPVLVTATATACFTIAALTS